MTHRHFRSTPAVYSSIAQQLDAAYGYPNAETLTERALPPVESLPTDSQGRVYLTVESAFCDYVLPSQLLPELLESGAVEELTQEELDTVFPRQPRPPRRRQPE